MPQNENRPTRHRNDLDSDEKVLLASYVDFHQQQQKAAGGEEQADKALAALAADTGLFRGTVTKGNITGARRRLKKKGNTSVKASVERMRLLRNAWMRLHRDTGDDEAKLIADQVHTRRLLLLKAWRKAKAQKQLANQAAAAAKEVQLELPSVRPALPRPALPSPTLPEPPAPSPQVSPDLPAPSLPVPAAAAGPAIWDTQLAQLQRMSEALRYLLQQEVLRQSLSGHQPDPWVCRLLNQLKEG